MKICPNCKMTVEAENECPVCYASITYEPVCESQKEIYVFNKYFWRYIIRQMWFSTVCVIAVVGFLFSGAKVNYLSVFSVLFALLSLSGSFFQRKIAKEIEWKYSKDYSVFKADYIKYFSGIAAVLFSFLCRFI